MLKGLLLRQAFVLVDLALAALVVFTGYVVVSSVLDGDWKPPQGGGEEAVHADYASLFTSVQQRSAYNSVKTSELFGPGANLAGDVVVEEVEPEPVPESVVDTELRLSLMGTAVSDAFLSSAVILNEDTRTPGTFFHGDEIVPNVSLEEIRDREVLLFNRNLNRREVLRMEDEGGRGFALAQASGPGVADTSGRGPIRVEKDRLVRELSDNYVQLVTTLDPVMHRDSTGRVNGITSRNVSKIPLATELGLRDGDVVQSVNGVAIDSEDKLFEIANKFQNFETFRLRVLRNGRVETLTYRLQ